MSIGIPALAGVLGALAFFAPVAAGQTDPRTYEGIYSVTENDLNQTRCEPTPFRRTLAAGQTGPSYQYRVAVTIAATRVSFSAESGNVSLFAADLAADGTFKNDGPENARGDFRSGGFRMTWVRSQGAGNCTTEFRGQFVGAGGGDIRPPTTSGPQTTPASTPSSGSKGKSPSGTIIAIGGIGAGTVTILILVNGKRVRRRPKLKPRGRTETGPNVWDPTLEQQRDKWNQDQKVWDPDTKTYRDPRPEDLVELPDWEPEITKTVPRDRVPPGCRDIYDKYVFESEQAHWAEQAVKDSEERYKKLEKLFQQNKLRAAAQVGIEIVGATTAIAESLVGAAGSSLLRAAKAPMRGLEDAIARRDSLLREVEQDIGVRNARQLSEHMSNRLRTAEADLPKAIAARQRLEQLTALGNKQGNLVKAAALRRQPLERRIFTLNAEIEHFEARLQTNLNRVQNELANVQAEIRRFETTIKPGGGPGFVDPARAQKLEGLKWREMEIKERLSDLGHGAEAKEIAHRRAELAATKAELDNQPGWDELVKDQARTRRQLEQTRTELLNLGDVSDAEVVRLRGLAERATQDLHVARLTARQRAQRELDALNAHIADLKSKVANLDANPTVPSTPVVIVQTVMGPIAVKLTKWFGSGDSPEEMVRILVQNKSDALEELKQLTTARAAVQEWTKTRMPETLARLQACMGAK